MTCILSDSGRTSLSLSSCPSARGGFDARALGGRRALRVPRGGHYKVAVGGDVRLGSDSGRVTMSLINDQVLFSQHDEKIVFS